MLLTLTIRTNTLSMKQALSRQVATNVKTSALNITLQRIVLRIDYGIHADTKLTSHDSAFSLASILLT